MLIDVAKETAELSGIFYTESTPCSSRSACWPHLHHDVMVARQAMGGFRPLCPRYRKHGLGGKYAHSNATRTSQLTQ